MTRRAALVLALVVPAACTAPPESGDECAEGWVGAVQSIELGDPAAGPFLPWEDGAVVEVVVGTQGLDMIPVRLRLRGDALPSCLLHTAMVVDSQGRTLVRQAAPLETSAEADGTYLTAALYIVFYEVLAPGTELTIAVEAAGETRARRVYAGCRDCPAP